MGRKGGGISAVMCRWVHYGRDRSRPYHIFVMMFVFLEFEAYVLCNPAVNTVETTVYFLPV